MIESLDYFATLVQQDASFPLFEAALALEQDVDPQLDLVASQAEVDMLAAKLQRRLPSDASHIQKLRMLNHFFYRELAFGGNLNNYYDPDNSYLHRVIASRRGIPISLAVVYMELAQQVGLDIKGISFPGHFLMKLSVQSRSSLTRSTALVCRAKNWKNGWNLTWRSRATPPIYRCRSISNRRIHAKSWSACCAT
jgi:regulator of sirC expression with transglutaminase-like and TPR domain